MMLIPDYHLQFTFEHQIRFRAVSSGIKDVQKYRVMLGFLKRDRAGLRIENHDPVPTLLDSANLLNTIIIRRHSQLFLAKTYFRSQEQPIW